MRSILCTASLLIVLIGNVSGDCYYVGVSGATYSALNGDYAYWSTVTCNWYSAWYQIYASQVNNIYFFPATYNTSAMWVLGLDLCQLVIAAKAEGYHEHPYDVPVGSWKEHLNGQWQTSSNLHVFCESGLSPGAIVGIVIGCVCGAILIVALLYLLYVYCHKKKQRRSAPHSPPPQTAAQAAAGHTNHNYMESSTYALPTPVGYYPPAGDAALMYPAGGAMGYDYTLQPMTGLPPYNNEQPPKYSNSAQLNNSTVSEI